jgi:cytochrome c551/c552
MRLPRLTTLLTSLTLSTNPLGTPGTSKAEDAAGLAQSKRCATCHSLDQPKVGPSFKFLAAKYAGNMGAEANIIARLQAGRGHPKVDASAAELKVLVEYVLSTK